jgi:hypothetical protein
MSLDAATSLSGQKLEPNRREKQGKAAKAGEASPGSIRPDFLVKRCCRRLNIFLQCRPLNKKMKPQLLFLIAYAQESLKKTKQTNLGVFTIHPHGELTHGAKVQNENRKS